MHHRFIRDSFVGRLTYHLSKHKFFNHKEDRPGFVAAEKYLPGYVAPKTKTDSDSSSGGEEKAVESSNEAEGELEGNGQILVDWDGDDDPENPYNWPLYQKVFFVFEIAILTTSVYMGSAIYTPGVAELQAQWGISRVEATLPLTLFVFGYGVGPLVFSPMSENAIFGRTSIYIVTLFIFVILQIPTALAKNIASLCVLRFLAGFFASPALATGGASVGDIISLPYIPVGIAAWSLAAVCGPSLGPLIGSVFAQLLDWRWTFWFMLILNGASLLILAFLLPETYQKTLLRRKAQRLRAVTGNENIVSAGEVENLKMTTREMVIDILWRPIEITLFEPVVLLINIYIAFLYSIMYLWFEAFPIVLINTYHFNLIEMGVSYSAIMIGIVIGASIYIPLIYKSFTKKLLAGNMVAPEELLPMSIFGACLMPAGVFIFAWSSSPDTHWIGPLIGTAIFAAGAFLVFQTLFNYLSMSFWQYLASVFASNDVFRSVMAGAFPLFGAPLYENLGSEKFPVGWGSTILAFILLAMVLIPVMFYLTGPKWRARSKYASH